MDVKTLIRNANAFSICSNSIVTSQEVRRLEHGRFYHSVVLAITCILAATVLSYRAREGSLPCSRASTRLAFQTTGRR